MYAILEVGAKQFKIKKGDIVDVERQNLDVGKALVLDKVLLVSRDEKIEIGKPYLPKAAIQAIVLKHLKAEKLVSFKYRRRKSSHWKKGHRQQLTRIKIKEIEFG